jgi:hypothetical protein
MAVLSLVNIAVSSGTGLLFHADRRTDMTKLIVVFRSFVNARYNVSGHVT